VDRLAEAPIDPGPVLAEDAAIGRSWEWDDFPHAAERGSRAMRI